MREPATQPAVASQRSPPSQKRPLSQLASFSTRTQESVASSQESSVQATASAQSGAAPSMQPARGSQVSTPLQKAPSSQAASLAGCRQESVASSQESIVHGTVSSQFAGTPAAHPATVSQVSAPLQKRPSSQRLLRGSFTQASVNSSQESMVQSTPSSQPSGAPDGSQKPSALQVSAPLQKSPSLQATGPPAVCMQTPLGSQESTVQALSSSQAASLAQFWKRMHSSGVAVRDRRRVGAGVHQP